MNKIVLALIVVVVIIIAGGAYVVFVPPSPDPAVLYIERGTVEVNRGSGWQSAHDDMDLKEGDRVRTTDGEATVVFLEGEIVHLQPNSEVAFDDIASDGISLSQPLGETWNRVTKLSGIKNYAVTTPNAVATVRGTTFFYSDDEVTVQDGVVSYGPQSNPNQVSVNPNMRASRNGWQTSPATDSDRAKFELFRQKQITALTRIREREINKHGTLLKFADAQGYDAAKRAQLLADIDNNPNPTEDDAYNKVPSYLQPQVERTYKLTKEIKRLRFLAAPSAPAPGTNTGALQMCPKEGKCRIWDDSCGGKGIERLMNNAEPQGCVDATQAAVQGIDYCGHFTLGSGGRTCNYQDAQTKQQCVCP